jgi:hypothetical protein
VNPCVWHPWGFFRSLPPIGIDQQLFGHVLSPFLKFAMNVSTNFCTNVVTYHLLSFYNSNWIQDSVDNCNTEAAFAPLALRHAAAYAARRVFTISTLSSTPYGTLR